MAEVKKLINGVKAIYNVSIIGREEEILIEDYKDYLDLRPEDRDKFIKLAQLLLPDKEETSTESDYDSLDINTKTRQYNRMTKLDAENISRYIGEKCRGRADIPRIIDDVYDYINEKFGKATIRDLLTGRTFTAISGRYFTIKNGKVTATK